MIEKPIFSDPNHFYIPVVANAIEQGLIKSLKQSCRNTELLIESIPQALESSKYQTDKWTIKQVIKHISDSERVHSYRALTIARKDKTVLPPFDEDLFALSDNSGNLSLEAIKEEFLSVRNSTIELFKTLSQESLDFEGIGNNMIFTPRIIGWLISGHNSHHCSVIESKYLRPENKTCNNRVDG
jgi:hypothetical protein